MTTRLVWIREGDPLPAKLLRVVRWELRRIDCGSNMERWLLCEVAK